MRASGILTRITLFLPTDPYLDYDTDITALAFAPDPELGTIDTPHGKVQFLQMVGLTSAEYEYLKPLNNVEAVEALLKKMQQDNPLLITDLDRR